jgi:hypothetical protein
MERSFMKIWILRFLALLITSVALAMIIYRTEKWKGPFDYIIEVGANDAEPIVKAVENLEISEIYIKTREATVFEKKPNIFKFTFIVFLIFGIMLGLYYSIYRAIDSFLFRPKKDKSILTQP